MWPESSPVNTVNLAKNYNSRVIDFFQGVSFWCALYTAAEGFDVDC